MEAARKVCLHMVLTTRRETFLECLASCGPDDTIVLMDSAVDWLAGPMSLPPIAAPIRVCCLAADVGAHGLQTQPAALGISMIDDHELVWLVRGHHHCLSWK